MFRHYRALLALAFAFVVFAGIPAAVAQQAAPQEAPKAVWINPVRGLAEVQYVQSPSRQEKDMIVTTFQVKNMSAAPIARLTIEEFWYDKARNPVTGDKQFLKKPLAPGEVGTIVLRTPKMPAMDAQMLKFSHQNGEVKVKRVPKFETAGTK
jgi:hypothetical protein